MARRRGKGRVGSVDLKALSQVCKEIKSGPMDAGEILEVLEGPYYRARARGRSG